MANSSAISESATIQFSDDDIAYLMNLLRNATQPVATQQLIDALRRQASAAQEFGNEDGGGASQPRSRGAD